MVWWKGFFGEWDGMGWDEIGLDGLRIYWLFVIWVRRGISGTCIYKNGTHIGFGDYGIV